MPHIRHIGEEKLDSDGEKMHLARRWVVERTLGWLSRCRGILMKRDHFISEMQIAYHFSLTFPTAVQSKRMTRRMQTYDMEQHNMNKRPFKRIMLLIGLVLLITGGVGLRLWSQGRQEALNRELIAALVTNDIPQAMALVNAGANPNTRYTPPVTAFQQLRNFVLRRSSPPVKEGATAFEMACGSRWDASYIDVFHWPVRSEWPQLVGAMLQHGANLNALDKDGLTPLHWAALTSRPQTVRVLVEHGAPINNVSVVCGISPLEVACAKCPDSVNLLLEHGANVNEQTKAVFRTALHCAVLAASAAPSLNDYKRTTEVIQQLLAHGADPKLRNAKGRTATESAQWEDCPALVPLLRKAEAKK